MAGGKFEVRSLSIIVPFAIAFLIGFLCICRRKIFLWRLKGKDEPEAAVGVPKVGGTSPKHVKTVSIDVDKYKAPYDAESGSRGAESESDSILMAEPGKGRKSFCG